MTFLESMKNKKGRPWENNGLIWKNNPLKNYKMCISVITRLKNISSLLTKCNLNKKLIKIMNTKIKVTKNLMKKKEMICYKNDKKNAEEVKHKC